MIQSVVASGMLVFANGYSITHTCQRISSLESYGKDQRRPFMGQARACVLFIISNPPDNPMISPHHLKPSHFPAAVPPSSPSHLQWRDAEPRFFWNRALLLDVMELGLDQWIQPVISAFVKSADGVQIGGRTCRLLLISRRSCFRQGTRYNVRGIDPMGNVANFVETEQIAVDNDGRVSSFVQIRGSIPVFWQQRINLKYNPPVVCAADEARNHAAMSKHFGELTAVYGANLCVNLIDKRKEQQTLGTLFQQGIDRIKRGSELDLDYVWFDFHHECRKMQWHNLAKVAFVSS